MNLDSKMDTADREPIRRSLCLVAPPFEKSPSLDERLLRAVTQEMAAIKTKYLDWYVLYEDCDPMSAPRLEVHELLATAPSDFSRGLLTGILLFRQQLAILTEERA